MKKFPSAIFTSQGQNSYVMHCLSCALFFCTCFSKGAAIGRRPPPVAIAGRWEVRTDWQPVQSHRRAGRRSDLSFAVPFLLACHAFMLSSHASFKSSSRCYTKPLAQFDSFQRWMTLRKSRAQSLLLFNQTWCCALVNVEWRRQTKQAAMKARTCFVQRVCKCMVVIVVLPWGDWEGDETVHRSTLDWCF